MEDSRFFTMSQLWQSLALTAVIGGVLVALVTFGITHFSTEGDTQALMASSTPANTDLPAAVVEARKDPFSEIQLSGKSAIVVDLSTGRTLYSQNADAQLPLASLTKLLTMYAADKVIAPTSVITISSSSLAQDGEYGLLEGESFVYGDLARFALVSSSNDAAEAITEAAEVSSGQSAEQFMSRAAQAAGLSHTKAVNGTGLDIDLTEAGAYGTARDMAKLASEFWRSSPILSEATTHTAVTAYSTQGVAHSLPNTNQTVHTIPGLKLSKTGYTDLAGGNLAIVFDAGINHPVAIVVLGSTRDARFTDVQTLIRATLASFEKHSS
jgi:serine-type D-Ala-D-Ala carboxypeptidase (penicillin-binding protein 5/6)